MQQHMYSISMVYPFSAVQHTTTVENLEKQLFLRDKLFNQVMLVIQSGQL